MLIGFVIGLLFSFGVYLTAQSFTFAKESSAIDQQANEWKATIGRAMNECDQLKKELEQLKNPIRTNEQIKQMELEQQQENDDYDRELDIRMANIARHKPVQSTGCPASCTRHRHSKESQ